MINIGFILKGKVDLWKEIFYSVFSFFVFVYVSVYVRVCVGFLFIDKWKWVFLIDEELWWN